MFTVMNYKGYTGKITSVDEKQSLFHGEIADINDVVTFEGKNLAQLLKAFHESVEDYLSFCAEEDEQPEKPYSGKFLVRITPELHRRAAMAAKRNALSLNAWVASAISEYLKKSQSKRRQVPNSIRPQQTQKSKSKLST